MSLKIGSKVRINPDSAYYGVQPEGCSSKDAVGTVKGMSEDSLTFKVEWYKLGSGKYSNSYSATDLIESESTRKTVAKEDRLRVFYDAGKIRVGTALIADGIEGMVGEIREQGNTFNGIYLFHDNSSYSGGCGKIAPDSLGFKYSLGLSPSQVVTLVSTPKVNKEKSVELVISRRGGKTYLDFGIPNMLEEIFKGKSTKTSDSKNWPGLSFYVMKQTDSSDYKRLLSQFNLFDNFGDEFSKEGRYNIAFIRTVGGKGNIMINDDLTLAEVSTITANIADFIKRWYQEFIRDYKVSMLVQLEIK